VSISLVLQIAGKDLRKVGDGYSGMGVGVIGWHSKYGLVGMRGERQRKRGGDTILKVLSTEMTAAGARPDRCFLVGSDRRNVKTPFKLTPEEIQ